MNKISFPKPFGLYIHFPFCQSKCRYCDFYSLPARENMIDEYINALEKEIELYKKILPNRQIETIYLGGGTPSLLSPKQLERVLKKIIDSFSEPIQKEITIEANPSSLNKRKIKSYHQLGINRLSLGIQSFLPEELSLLGRIHTSAQAFKILDRVSQEYKNYNIDLIYGLPGQDLKKWLYSLKSALDFKPPHLSIYGLQIEEGTELAAMVNKGELAETSDELEADMYLQARHLLNSQGYNHYEISNYAYKGLESRHNLLYWQYKPYLGLGAAGHSFTGNLRFRNVKKLTSYFSQIKQEKLPVTDIIELTEKDIRAEMVFMGLRLTDGISRDKFKAFFKEDAVKIYRDKIKKLEESGLIEITQDKIRLTEKGLLLGNEVFVEFL